MKHNRLLLSALLCAGLLASGCGDASGVPAEPTASLAETTTAAAETTTSAAETTTASAAETTASAETTTGSTAAQTAETAAGSTAAQTAGSVTEELSLLAQLADRIEHTDDAVELHYAFEDEGLRIAGDQVVHGRSYYMRSETPFYTIKACSDGNTVWMLHDETKTFARITGDEGEDLIPDTMVPDFDEIGEVLERGTETFKGKNCRYEDYYEEDGEDMAKVRYYFDDKGDMLGMKALSGEDEGIIYAFEMRVNESPDRTLFAPPAGYSEIDEKELVPRVMANFLEMLGGAAGSTEDNDD